MEHVVGNAVIVRVAVAKTPRPTRAAQRHIGKPGEERRVTRVRRDHEPGVDRRLDPRRPLIAVDVVTSPVAHSGRAGDPTHRRVGNRDRADKSATAKSQNPRMVGHIVNHIRSLVAGQPGGDARAHLDVGDIISRGMASPLPHAKQRIKSGVPNSLIGTPNNQPIAIFGDRDVGRWSGQSVLSPGAADWIVNGEINGAVRQPRDHPALADWIADIRRLSGGTACHPIAPARIVDAVINGVSRQPGDDAPVRARVGNIIGRRVRAASGENVPLGIEHLVTDHGPVERSLDILQGRGKVHRHGAGAAEENDDARKRIKETMHDA